MTDPVCITGMHRSGTSLVARLLRDAGLFLGHDADFLPADAHNADGYWEHRGFVDLDEALLDALGGGWDAPPPPADPSDARAAEFYEAAARLVGDLAAAGAWGWKDPRSALVLPFWETVVPDLRVVVCVRDPLEVLLSLQRRGAMSPLLGVGLWIEYNRRILATVPPERRVVTCYSRYFADPVAELERVLGAVAVPAERATIEAAAGAVRESLRHHVCDGDLRRSGVPEEAVQLYEALLAEADGGSPAAPAAGELPRRPAVAARGLAQSVAVRQRADALRAEVTAYRSDRDEWRAQAVARGEEIERLAAESESLRAAAVRLERDAERAVDLEAQLGLLRDQLQDVRLAHTTAAAEAARVAEQARELHLERDALRDEVQRLRASEAASAAKRAAGAKDLTRLRRELETARKEVRLREEERLTWQLDATGARAEAAAQAEEAGRLRTSLDAERERGEGLRAEIERLRAQQDVLLGERVRLTDAVRSAEAAREAVRETASAVEPARAEPAERARRRRTPARRRFYAQLASWLARPTRERREWLRAYFELRRSNEFDWATYLLHNPDVARAGLDPLLHYVEHGRREHRVVARPGPPRAARKLPSASLPPLAIPPPVAAASMPPALAPAAAPADADVLQAIRESGLFDDGFYRATYPDVSESDLTPVEHFCAVGWREGRQPNAYFDTEWYLRTYPEVERRGVNPLWDYVAAGETRWPCAYFDPAFYARTYGPAGGALADYLARLRVGEWRNPVELFDVGYYLEHNPDVAASGTDPVLHYLYTGHAEGRDPSPGFSTSAYRTRHMQGRRDSNPLVHHYERRLGADDVPALPVAEEVRQWVLPGPEFEDAVEPPPSRGRRRAKVVAFYLPQFHAIPENDEWWGRGFTEWHNVVRGTPRFVGHHQPRIPRDLGFYDLTDPETMRRQVQLAKDAGVHGFAFYYYWFNGKRLLERPVERFLTDRSLDLPFCLMWANENWTRRWDGLEQEVLIAQEYRKEDDAALVDDFQRHFADERYIRVDGRPLLFVYRVDVIPDARRVLRRLRRLWQERHAENPLMLMGQGFGGTDPREYGLDGAFEFPPHKLVAGMPAINPNLTITDPGFSGHVFDYGQVVSRSLEEPAPDYPLVKTAVPSWDNDARRQGRGLTLHGSSPRRYEEWLRALLDRAAEHPLHGESLVLVNAWNEWAEAAYLEPDAYYGSAYLNATARAISAPAARDAKPRLLLVGHDAHPHGAQMIILHVGETLRSRFGCEVRFILLDSGPLLPDYQRVGETFDAMGDHAAAAARAAAWRDQGFDIAFTNTAVAGTLVPELKDAGYEVVSLVHELAGMVQEYALESAVANILERSDVVVAPSAPVRDGLVAASTRDREIVVRAQGLYRPVRRDPAAGARIRRDLRLPADARVVLNVGWGDLRKGADIFLSAARVAAHEAPELHFVWVGKLHEHTTRWLMRDVDDALRERVHFVPHVDDVAAYLSAADVFFLSSREDPFPSVVLEALAAELPVVGLRGGSGSEPLIEEFGILADRNDIPGVVRALREATRASSGTERAARRAAIEERYRYDDYAFDLLRLVRPDLVKVTAVVPNYNYAPLLRDRLRTIFEQTYPIFEVIVLDDCSTDDSLRELERLREGNGWSFRVVASEANSGSPFRQWEKGCRLARGEYVWIAEADDLSEPRFLQEVAERLRADDAGFAFSDSRPIDADGITLDTSYQTYYRDAGASYMEQDFTVDGPSFVRRCLAARNFVLNVSAVVWRRDALLGAIDRCHGGLDDYRLVGDWHLYAAAAMEARFVSYIAEPLNVHRRHGGSVTGELAKEAHVEEIERVHAAIADWLGADEEERARMEEYVRELRETFGIAGEAAGATAGATNGAPRIRTHPQ